MFLISLGGSNSPVSFPVILYHYLQNRSFQELVSSPCVAGRLLSPYRGDVSPRAQKLTAGGACSPERSIAHFPAEEIKATAVQ